MVPKQMKKMGREREGEGKKPLGKARKIKVKRMIRKVRR
jgi:hypothetical protein